MTNQFQFQQSDIHETLIIIKESNKSIIVGYVHKHPQGGYWFWFVKDKVGPPYSNKDDAIRDLVNHFLTAKFDLVAQKMGIKDNDKFTKK